MVRCIARKTLPQRVSPLNQITSNGPLDLVCIDFLPIEPDSKGIANVLILTDHFTRYAQAFPTKDQKALAVAKVLLCIMVYRPEYTQIKEGTLKAV